MRWLPTATALILGCSSSAPPPQATTPEPEPAGIVLDGQVLYAAPLEEAPASLRDAWGVFERNWAQEPPAAPEDAPAAEYRAFANQRMAPYVDSQVRAAMDLVRLLQDAADAEARLVLSVLAARLLHRGASWMWTLPLPAEAQVNPAARQALEQSMRGAAQNLAEYAREAFVQCVEAAGDTPEYEPWRADCARRAEALERILSAQIGPPPPTPMPEGCEDHTEPRFASPQHDPEGRAQLLVLVDAQSESVDEAAVQRAVERWARREHGLRAVPAARRRAAERLVEAGRTTRRGPECAAAPTLTWVLGAQIEHLVVAEAKQACHPTIHVDGDGRESEPEPVCDLTIAWHRAGSGDTEGLPPFFRRELPPDATTEAVVESLSSEPPPRGGLLGALRGGSAVRLNVAPVQANPGYRLRATFGGLGLGECQAERGASRLQLGWTVTPTGAVDSVTVEGGTENVRTCVREKLEQLTLTCTPGGEPIAMQTTLCLAR